MFKRELPSSKALCTLDHNKVFGLGGSRVGALASATNFKHNNCLMFSLCHGRMDRSGNLSYLSCPAELRAF